MIIRFLLIGVAIIEFYSYIPQIIKILKTKKANDLCIKSWFLWSISSTIYTLYVGLMCFDLLLLLTSFLEAILNATTLFLVMLYSVRIREIEVPASKNGYRLMEVRHAGYLYRVSSYRGQMEFNRISRILKRKATSFAVTLPISDSGYRELNIIYYDEKGEVKDVRTFDYTSIEDTVIKLRRKYNPDEEQQAISLNAHL